MRTNAIACFALTAACAIAVAIPSAQAENLTPVTIGAVGSGSATNWPIYVAMAQGFFKADGLDVNFVGTPASSSVQQQLAAGSIEIGAAAINEALDAMGSGAPITLLRLQLAKGPYDVYAKSSIHTMAQLKGKTVMLASPKDITVYYFDRMAAGEGLNPANCDFIYAGSSAARLSALLSGSIDATMLNPPFMFIAQAKGFSQLPVRAGYDNGLPFDGLEVNLKWGKSHKPAVRKFLEAYQKGVTWLYDPANREQAQKILLSRVRLTPNQADGTYDVYVKGRFYVSKDTIEKSDLQNEIDLLKTNGSLSGSADFSRFYKPAALGLTK